MAAFISPNGMCTEKRYGLLAQQEGPRLPKPVKRHRGRVAQVASPSVIGLNDPEDVEKTEIQENSGFA